MSFATVSRTGLGLLYSVLWAGGVYTWCGARGTAAPPWAAPLFLLLAAAITALESHEIAAPAIFALGGFLAEVVGVHAGIPFGPYSYSAALGLSVAGVPLAIACAWVVLLLFARDLASRITSHRWAAVAAGALIMTAFDLLIDPVATTILGYWQWEGRGAFFGVPVENFAGWFAVSALLLAAAPAPRRRSNTLALCGASVIAFFALIAAFA